MLVGFVDGHTHPVWSGDRVHEFAMKVFFLLGWRGLFVFRFQHPPSKLQLAGATYMDIHKKGGGIGFTVQHTRASSEEELLQLLLGRLSRMLKFGTYDLFVVVFFWETCFSFVCLFVLFVYLFVLLNSVGVFFLFLLRRTVVEAKSGILLLFLALFV